VVADEYQPIAPARVLREIAAAVPAECRDSMIIIGSLAVGYRYFATQGEMVVRTKDADCLLAPRVAALRVGAAITEQLLTAGWRLRPGADGQEPGDDRTPDERLPAVRLQSPQARDWFLELLTLPASSAERGRQWLRVKTSVGDLVIASFGFLALPSLDPIMTDFGIAVARPEMMALANLLEHPAIGSQTMSGGFAGRPGIKRSNKDLGRAVAIARLAAGENEAVLGTWFGPWQTALQVCFPDDWLDLAKRVGQGLRQLLASPADLEEAHFTCVNGLLASSPPTLGAFTITARRLLLDAAEPLERDATASP
jgi:hypothetical protein